MSKMRNTPVEEIISAVGDAVVKTTSSVAGGTCGLVMFIIEPDGHVASTTNFAEPEFVNFIAAIAKDTAAGNYENEDLPAGSRVQ